MTDQVTEEDGPTVSQYETLIDKIDELRTELAAHRYVVMTANRRSKAAMILTIVGATLCVVGIYLALSARHDVSEANESRATARISACVQDNVTTGNVRAAVVSGLLTFVPDPANLTAEQTAALNAYEGAVAAILKFRDCSPEGITAYYASPPLDPALEP